MKKKYIQPEADSFCSLESNIIANSTGQGNGKDNPNTPPGGASRESADDTFSESQTVWDQEW